MSSDGKSKRGDKEDSDDIEKSKVKATIWAAIISGVLGIVGGVSVVLFTNVLNSPGQDRFDARKAEVLERLTTQMTLFNGARQDLIRHLEKQPSPQATAAHIDEGVKLHREGVARFREMRSTLLLAGAMYGGDVEKLATQFIDWHIEEEKKRRYLHVSEYVQMQEYEDWSKKIIDAVALNYR